MTTWKPDEAIDFDASIDRHQRWGVDPVNIVEGAALYRVTEGAAYRARQLPDGRIHIDADDESAALADLQWKLGEALPRRSLAELAGRDERVARLVERFPGLRPPIIGDPFESLVTAITAQQVNLTWATTTRRRLVHRAGTAHHFDGVTVWEFPTPGDVIELGVGTLRELQFTTRKSEYIVGVAQAALEGALDDLGDLSNREVIERLTAIRGIGRWSADWLLARCLSRPDVVAAGDLGVRTAVSFSYFASDAILSEEVVRSTAEAWGDAANLTAHLLLATL